MIVCYQHKVWHFDARVIQNPFIAWSYPKNPSLVLSEIFIPSEFYPEKTEVIAIWKIKTLHQKQ
jgi:hypothetical protein